MTNTIRSVAKAMRIFLAFDDRSPEFSVTELSRRVGFPKSVAYKLLRTLAAQGFLQQDPLTRRYRIGPAILTVAGAFLRSEPLTREGLPVLRQLSATTGHTATLGILGGSDVLFVGAVEGSCAVRAGAKVGDRRPVHATASGKILLSGLPDREVERLLGHGPLPRLTPFTTVDAERLKKELAVVRKTGVAYNLRERSEEICSVAAAVRNHLDQIVAAIGVTFSSHLESPGLLEQLSRAVQAHAWKLSRRLGAPSVGRNSDGQRCSRSRG
ncbi:MAG: IclR family transcriptional regulator [Armatimonadetes bacterium]|nr:IclR family transcriptional regulator [Armatimonadota bacterium]